MDQALRNALRNTVSRCRVLLEEAVGKTLEGHFGVRRDGEVEDAARLTHLSPEELQRRGRVVSHLRHIESGGHGPAEAVTRLVREVSYTHLNRLCAYKMLERRGLIRESVGRGTSSNGFMFYLAGHPEQEELRSAGRQDEAYRNFLVWQGGELSNEIGVLFSAEDPASNLFPPQRVLGAVLDLVNAGELSPAWDEEETIGWVYQYYTPREQREEARKASQAPRDSHELSFRNQFYTPRYVVRFLADNTLGRAWYEMRRGETSLAEECGYLVRRPDEASPHRAIKDPRELRVLDPACGSGHFLLYCFDLLETVYAEAYEDERAGAELREEYPDREEFRRAVPGMILSRNLHGVDIDLRATQISALALWMRAQRAYSQMGLGKEGRPEVTRVNVVCAEPMPGEEDLLEEFAATLDPPLLGQLVEVVFEEARLAGEAGSLLKVEGAAEEAIGRAKARWQREYERDRDSSGNERLLTGGEMDRLSSADSPGSLFDVSQVTDEEFWDRAEGLLLESLQSYASEASATDGKGYRRRLFANDAGAGFAFVDTFREPFDVVLMNPPFGEASKPSKSYIHKHYPRTRNDLYAAFVERGLGLLRPGGYLGAITSRTGFFLSSFQKWREEVLLGEARPTAVADLGQGVLDTAMVETAAYVLRKRG